MVIIQSIGKRWASTDDTDQKSAAFLEPDLRLFVRGDVIAPTNMGLRRAACTVAALDVAAS